MHEDADIILYCKGKKHTGNLIVYIYSKRKEYYVHNVDNTDTGSQIIKEIKERGDLMDMVKYLDKHEFKKLEDTNTT